MDEQKREALKQCMHQAGPEKTLPVVVRLMPDGNYELVDGEHRWTIAKELGWEKMTAVVREADDLQAKAFCVSYNKLRGRFNWFKLYDVIKSDQDNGINLEETYKDALSNRELKWILSLSNLVPQARIILENSLRKYPEYTLEHLHLMSKIPPDQQENLSETYKKPIALHLLTRLITAFPQKNPPHPTTEEGKYYSPDNHLNQPNNTSEKTTNPNSNSTDHDSNDFTEQPNQEDTLLELWQPKWPNKDEDAKDLDPQTDDHNKEQIPKTTIKKPRALLLSVEHNCNCGRFYQVNFKKKTVIAQKENMLCEYVDINTYTFLVHCDKCNNDHEVKINNTENDDEEAELILCSRCDPVRKGWVNVNTCEITWR